MPSSGSLWIAFGTSIVISAGTLWNQSRLARQYRNWNLYITEKHKIYPVMWEKLYTTSAIAIRVIQGPSPTKAIKEWDAHLLTTEAPVWRRTGDKEERAMSWYKAKLLAEFEPKAYEIRQYFLASQLYMSESLQESVDAFTEQLMGLVQQQHGIHHPTWSESLLTAKLNEIKKQLQSELAQPGPMEKLCKILRAKFPAFSREPKKPPIQ